MRYGSAILPDKRKRVNTLLLLGALGVEMLRYAQHDRVLLSPHSLRSGQALSRSELSLDTDRVSV